MGRPERALEPVAPPIHIAVPEDVDLLETDPGAVLSHSYDIVCNGQEIGCGSIRIHNRDMLAQIFAALGIGEDEAQRKFGHMLEAFEYGAPPHGGIAIGIDRTAALFAGSATSERSSPSQRRNPPRIR